jgi:uncharacterized protein YjeT (DUF2065 family)
MDLWQALAIGVAMAMILEGILPFVSPERWRQAMLTAARWPDAALRKLGLASLLSGVFLLYWVH